MPKKKQQRNAECVDAAPAWQVLQERILDVVNDFADENPAVPNALLLTGVSCLCWKWRKRSSVKITERTDEEATEAVHAGRKSMFRTMLGTTPQAYFRGRRS